MGWGCLAAARAGSRQLTMARALVQNASDRNQVRAAGKKEKEFRKRELNDVRSLLAIAPGRRFLWRLLSSAGVFRSSYTGDANGTMFNEGRRDLGLMVLSETTEADPNAYAKMVQESKADEIPETPEPPEPSGQESKEEHDA
jgi:hypothetical protein